MSKQEAQEYDRDAALANLTEEERAAIEDDDLSPEEKAALEDIAGDDDGDDDEDDEDLDADDEGTEDDDVAGVGGTQKPVSKTDESAAKKTDDDAAAVADESVDDFRPKYQAQLPEDFGDQMKALDDREVELAKRFKDGELEADEFMAENKRLLADRAKLDRLATKAEIAQEMSAQTMEQEWAWTVKKFIQQVKRDEGIDYATDPRGADFDNFIRVLASKPENANWDGEKYLIEAHKRTKVLHGAQDKARDNKPNEKPKARTPDASKLPATLANVPGGDGPGDVGSEFADIDKLDGLAYEQALAKMTPAQRERYLATA